MDDELSLALADLDEKAALGLVTERLARGDDPAAILKDCQQGMLLVGQRYQAGEYFVSELLMAGEIFKEATALLAPTLKGDGAPARGKVVAGTVKNDMHDIGKDIVVAMLRSANYEVIDLGVNVPPERFVAALKETGAPVLALSGLLTISFSPMKETVRAVEAAGLRPGVRVMIGGGPVTEMVREYTAADAWGADAQAAVVLCNQWMEEAGK